MDLTIALAGDTMLGRGVGEGLAAQPEAAVCAPEVGEVTRAADLFVLNLECCISERGAPWPDPSKPFFFRAPPVAATTLAALGVSAVTLANNHALDYGATALADTLTHLEEAGIAHAGAGPDLAAARRPAVVEAGGSRVALLSVSDHPAAFAATQERPGIAYADLRAGVPAWLPGAVAQARAGTDVVLVSPHWGPNMVAGPVPPVRAAAEEIAAAGPDLVAGHSAHVFHGLEVVAGCPVLYDLGDFVDDYAVDPVLRNDLGLLWLVTVEDGRARRLDVLPLALEYAYTRPAVGPERAWVVRRLREAVAPLEVADHGGSLCSIDLTDLASTWHRPHQPLRRAGGKEAPDGRAGAAGAGP